VNDPLAAVLREIVGTQNVLVDPGIRAAFETDWTRRFHGVSRCVVRPGSADEVAMVLRACAAEHAAVVPQGGNTGLVGGGVPRGGEVVLSLLRIDGIEHIDPHLGEVTCGAGLTLGALNEAAGAHGLRLGVDLAARGSATVGGMVATNAGGINVLRYGMMRSQVLGFEAVLANGSVIDRLEGPAKDNSGYDLGQLLAGSEGTLAVITRLRLRLVPVLPHSAVALFGAPTPEAAIDLAQRARAHFDDLEAAEFFLPEGLDLVRHHTGASNPFRRRWAMYVLFEIASRKPDVLERFAEFMDTVPGLGEGQMDGTFAQDAMDRKRLWALRERHTEAINSEGVPVKLDVAIPLARLPRFLDEVRGAVTSFAPSARAIIFGHLADANLHVNILGADGHEEAVTGSVLRLVAALKGSISAEHGIGIAKSHWLGLTRSPQDIAVMRAIKRALDPEGILNPGVIFTDTARPVTPPARRR
jgi:FAD/FMN-containing dehydrogenase